MNSTPRWLLALSVLTGCAPQEHTEVKTAVASHRLPQRVCSWEPRVTVDRVPAGLMLALYEQHACRFVEERQVRTEVSTQPNMVVFVLESAATVAGGVLIVNALACDESGLGCYAKGIGGWIGIAIAIPAGTATLVDAFDFGSETRVDLEHRPLPDGAEVYEVRALPNVTVTLELGDGRTVSSVSDGQGRAWLRPPAGAREGELRVGTMSRKINWEAR